MTFKEYQEAADSTAIYPDRGNNLVYPTLGLVGESGEVAEKVKKLIRDAQGEQTPEFRAELAKEVGDVLWYISQVAREIGTDIESVAAANIEKLRSRKERGVIHGGGDNR